MNAQFILPRAWKNPLAAMAASIPETLLQLDASLVVQSASRALGNTRIEELVGRPLAELVGRGQRATLARVLGGALKDQRPVEFALRVGGPSQPVLHARATPIVVADQATGLAVSVFPPRPAA